MPASRFNKPGWANQVSGLRVKVLTVAVGIGVNIAVAGIRANKDVMLAAFQLGGNAAWAAQADCGELPVITSDGNIQFPTLTQLNKIICIIYDASN